MSIYGSLFSGVSGLNAQVTAISVLSDNVSNINTVGYKANSANFATLVTDSGSSNSFSSGGVSANNRQLIDKQGLIQGTGVSTDIAISGKGFFVVNDQTDGSGSTLYTRAGSFRQDNRGNFVNAAGFTLMGWQLDGEGRLPGENGNLNTTSAALVDSLSPINMKAVSGLAAATTTVDVGINLDATQTILEGAGQTITPLATSTENGSIAARSVIVPNANMPNNQPGNVGIDINVPDANNTFTYGGVTRSVDITGTVLGAATPTQPFTGATDGWTFTITTVSAGTTTFTYRASSPTTSNGEFNTLTTMATAIDEVNGLSARVVANRLYIASVDGEEQIAISDVVPGTFTANLYAADPLLAAGPPAVLTMPTQVGRYSTLQGLANLVNNTADLTAVVENPLDNTSVRIFAKDPLTTITFANNAGNPVGSNPLAELGLTAATNGPKYDATLVTKNLAGGTITPHFSRNVRVFDAIGSGHDLRVSFVKLAANTWGVEMYGVNSTGDINTTRTDAQIASGTVVFNGDGSLRSVSNSLTQPINISWLNQAIANSITFNYGTAGQVAGTTGATQIGLTDGLRQFASPYNVEFLDQNGVSAGLLTSTNIDEDGFVVANFSNGKSQKVFKLPIVDFANPNGLKAQAGNVYAESQSSGSFNLKEAGKGGVGKIVPSSLEQANVELADELTRMIVAQRGYQASAKVIATADELLEELNRTF